MMRFDLSLFKVSNAHAVKVLVSLAVSAFPLFGKGMFDGVTTCGFPGLRFSDDVLYQGILDRNAALIKCAVQTENASLASPRICYKLPTCETIYHIFDKTSDKKQLELIIQSATATQLQKKTARGENSMDVLIRKFGSRTDKDLIAALKKKGFAPEERLRQIAAATPSPKQSTRPKKSQSETKSSDFIAHPSRICLSYRGDGSLVCTAANAKTMSCPGDKEWRGQGPCSKYRSKRVSDLSKKQWKDLIWVYNRDVEKRNEPPSSPRPTKADNCRRACIAKKCRRYNQPGTYQESASAGMRCHGFCEVECSNNPDAYR
jgi:hypothetical protein